MIIIHTVHRPLKPTEQMMLRSLEQGNSEEPGDAYDHTDMVELARAQWPSFPALALALEQCGPARRVEDTIIFCAPDEAHEREPIGRLLLLHEDLGELALTLVLDESTTIGFAVERIALPEPMHEVFINGTQ